MILPTFKSLQSSDFDPQYKDLIDKLALILNNDIQGLYNTLQRSASLKDNLLCIVKDVPVVVDSDGNTVNSANFAIDIPNMRVRGCEVIRAVNIINSNTYPTGAPFINFTPGTQQVTIDHVTGLRPGDQWTLTVLAWGI